MPYGPLVASNSLLKLVSNKTSLLTEQRLELGICSSSVRLSVFIVRVLAAQFVLNQLVTRIQTLPVYVTTSLTLLFCRITKVFCERMMGHTCCFRSSGYTCRTQRRRIPSVSPSMPSSRASHSYVISPYPHLMSSVTLRTTTLSHCLLCKCSHSSSLRYLSYDSVHLTPWL